MTTPSSDQNLLDGIIRLFEYVASRHPSLLPASRWLVATSHVAANALEATRPSPQELQRLGALLRDEASHLAALLELLVDSEEPVPDLILRMQLDALIRNLDWNHPSEVIRNPPLQRLLFILNGEARDLAADKRERLDEVRLKLLRALELRRTSSQRRYQAAVDALSNHSQGSC